MIIFKEPSTIHSYCSVRKGAGDSIGFVPTMGALHAGHIALVKQARSDNQLVVCSIFVNPTQFNDPRDFEKYPTTIEQDILLLEKAGCDLLFLPAVACIYPDGMKTNMHYDLGYLEEILEGKFRPGHFQGVCQVVHRLLTIVAPHKLYLGQKDFQQCMVLQKMVSLLGLETDIIICSTLREKDGLAMSSRNMRLNPGDRGKATSIFKSLQSVKENIQPGSLQHLKQGALGFLTNEGFKVDYIEIAEAANLQAVNEWNGTTPLVVLAAAFLNDVRLIDNLLI